MKRFNLSQWALDHRPFVFYLMLFSIVAGLIAYWQLGRDEDPPFAFRAMVVTAQWPGASTEEMMVQVTDRIEKKLQETLWLKYEKSYTKPGEVTGWAAYVAGVLWALFVTHTTFNVPSLMGMIMAIGVATSNSVLLITFADDSRRGGFNAHDSNLRPPDLGGTMMSR